MKVQRVVCSRCNKIFEIAKDAKRPELCPQCLQALEDEKIENSSNEELINRTLDKDLLSNLKPINSFATLIDYCIYFAVSVGASDLHLKPNRAPIIRKGSVLFDIVDTAVSSEEIFEFAKRNNKLICDIDDTTKTFDFAIELEKRRFRCNTYHELNGWCCSLRLISIISTDFEKLGIPVVLKELVKRKSGLILLTGPTGSGKTTTMSALIEYLNETTFKHIITIEDPIEFVYPKGKCVITQREIGRDAISYEYALVDALREDPDIIVVGEMRDMESIEASIRAVETGHIVISTLHTRGTASTVNRIIDVFPYEKQAQIRSQISLNLICSVTQQLVPTLKAGELALATEVMIMNDAVRSSIRENKLHFINSTIELNKSMGMHTMKQDLERLKDANLISASNFERYQIK